MTLLELKERVDFALQGTDGEDLEVCIPNNKPSVGPLAVTKVRGAGKGIDWDGRRFFIWPENKMIEVEQGTKRGDSKA